MRYTHSRDRLPLGPIEAKGILINTPVEATLPGVGHLASVAISGCSPRRPNPPIWIFQNLPHVFHLLFLSLSPTVPDTVTQSVTD